MNRGRNDQKRWKLTLSFIPNRWWRLCMFHGVQRKSFFYGANTPGQVCPMWASWKCATAPWWPVEEESTSRWGGNKPQQLLRMPEQAGSELPQHHTSNTGIGKSGVGQRMCLVHCFSPRGVIRFRLLSINTVALSEALKLSGEPIAGGVLPHGILRQVLLS